MRILAIETSCDETAVSILEADERDTSVSFRLLGNALLSQIDIHKEYGGVFPALAKRAHAENLVPLLAATLEEAELLRESAQDIPEELQTTISEMLTREPELREALFAFISECERPNIDAIAVTHGPGLEPALWVGVNFARALSLLWDLPIVPVNHLEGHILSSLLTETGDRSYELHTPAFPLVSLVISGGHTEIVVTHEFLSYERIGETRDDAVGEAFDKVARMLGLPYPGGPEVSRLAALARTEGHKSPDTLPRPMIDAPTCDFSFSGLKTAVMYLLKAKGELTEAQKAAIAREFDDAVAEVLYKKTDRAVREVGARSLAIGGGVSASDNIREVFRKKIAADHPETTLYVPAKTLTGDNAVMIGVAGYYRAREGAFGSVETLSANGNLSLTR